MYTSCTVSIYHTSHHSLLSFHSSTTRTRSCCSSSRGGSLHHPAIRDSEQYCGLAGTAAVCLVDAEEALLYTYVYILMGIRCVCYVVPHMHYNNTYTYTHKIIFNMRYYKVLYTILTFLSSCMTVPDGTRRRHASHRAEL